MEQTPTQFLETLQSGIEDYSKADPETMQRFMNLNENALKPGALDTKTKTLMCVAIALATSAECCIAGRTAAAIQEGATRDEILETASVALLMGGSLCAGPIATQLVGVLNELLPAEGGK
jgi:AhpD family alkylhydroperoxidase